VNKNSRIQNADRRAATSILDSEFWILNSDFWFLTSSFFLLA
jgi:hypothetical protein